MADHAGGESLSKGGSMVSVRAFPKLALAALMAVLSLPAVPSLPAAAQGEANPVQVVRGVSAGRPYTLAYPRILEQAGGGDLVLRLPANSPARAPGTRGTYEVHLTISPAAGGAPSFDRERITAEQRRTFPDFTLTGQPVRLKTRSGPALVYQGEMTSRAPGRERLAFTRAELTDQGQLYRFDIYAGRNLSADVEPITHFILANFSTKADGVCCVQPEPATPAQ
jgi:hypothetical protein